MTETPNSIIDSVQEVDDPMNRVDQEIKDQDKDPVNPPPPSYYIEFTTPNAMEPPKLDLFTDKN